MRLNFRGTKLSQIANLLNIRGFYCGCWERIDMVDQENFVTNLYLTKR